jgi:hypothetical protein
MKMEKQKDVLKYEKPTLNRLDAGVKGKDLGCNSGYDATFCNSGPSTIK